MIITIDGPAGSGKSTVAKILARRLSISNLNTGAMYRAVTLFIIENKIDTDNEVSIEKSLKEIKIDFFDNTIFLNGKDVSERIKDLDVEQKVSKISSLKSVREKMVELQRMIGNKISLVAEGRDTGTVVFPNAEFKFYLDASVNERAKRRYKELTELGIKDVTISEIEKEIEKRDFQDRTRKLSPLKVPENAIIIDTTGLSIDEVVEKMLSYIKN